MGKTHGFFVRRDGVQEKVQASANDSEMLFLEVFPFSTSLGGCLRRHRSSLFDLAKEVKHDECRF